MFGVELGGGWGNGILFHSRPFDMKFTVIFFFISLIPSDKEGYVHEWHCVK